MNNKYNNLTYEDLKKKFFIIAGPCVIENREHCLYMAKQLKEISEKLNFTLIFKASFDKANRTSINSFRGIGIDDGLKILNEVKEVYGLPILTDVHESWQCEKVAEVADILQIPAFLSRQTDLLLSACKTGKIINIKKGQFMCSNGMKKAVDKCIESGNNNIIMCDRGTMFGYGDLVVDFRNLIWMKEDHPNNLVIQDITHCVQQPSSGDTTGGLRKLIPTMARCAVASGVDGLFMEVHDDPKNALSDSSTQWELSKTEPLLQELINIRNVTFGPYIQYQ